MRIWSLVDDRWREGDAEGAILRWFDLAREDGDQLHALANRYHLHPLAVEDCLSPMMHAPKIDDFGNVLFIVLQTLDPGIEGPVPEELDLFVGHDFFISYSDGPGAGNRAAMALDSALRNGIGVRPGADGLAYELADRAVDDILPQVHALAERLESLQSTVLAGSSDNRVNREVLELRARAGRIRRVLVSELGVVQRLSRGEFTEIAEPNRIYFRDVYDHLVRVDLGLEELREDAEVALSTYLSAFNNRISDVMKVLAVVGALALPASVIAGIFGTNFDNVPGLHSNWGFLAMILSMTGLAGGMAWYFRHRGWF